MRSGLLITSVCSLFHFVSIADRSAASCADFRGNNPACGSVNGKHIEGLFCGGPRHFFLIQRSVIFLFSVAPGSNYGNSIINTARIRMGMPCKVGNVLSLSPGEVRRYTDRIIPIGPGKAPGKGGLVFILKALLRFLPNFTRFLQVLFAKWVQML